MGDLTVICGENKSGKSFLSQVLFGFLDKLPSMHIQVPNKVIGNILDGNKTLLPIAKYRKYMGKRVLGFANEYSRNLGKVFAKSNKDMQDAEFQVQLTVGVMFREPASLDLIDQATFGILAVKPTADGKNLEFFWSNDEEDETKPNREVIEPLVKQALVKSLLSI